MRRRNDTRPRAESHRHRRFASLRLAERAAGSVLALTICTLAACAPPADHASLEAVEPPPDLHQLDAAVQRQFADLWARLETARRAEDRSRRAGAWGDLGRFFDVYDYADSAGRSYRNAHRLDPEEPRWPYYLGVLATSSGDLEAAVRHLEIAASLAPGETAPRVRLGDVALARADLDRAEALYASVLAEQPDEPGALLGSGRLALLRDEPESAIESLERLVRDQPEAARAHYSLSLAWRRLGDEERAAEHLAAVPADNLDQISLELEFAWDRELQSFDRGARTLTRRGVRAFRRGENARAAALLGAAVEADPDGAEKRINYALALRRAHRPAAARRELESALRLSAPNSDLRVKSHLEMGRLLAAAKRPQASVEHFEAALKIDEDSVAAHVELGRVFQLLERPEDALHHYAAARATERPLHATSFWHAALLMGLDRHREGRRALEEDLERLGDDRALRLLLARALSTTADPAIRDAGRARDLLRRGDAKAAGPDVLYAETAAMVAAADRRFAEARAWQQAAIEVLDGLRRPRAAHAAHRRMALYRDDTPCTTPWETNEAMVTLPVRPPDVEGGS